MTETEEAHRRIAATARRDELIRAYLDGAPEGQDYGRLRAGHFVGPWLLSEVLVRGGRRVAWPDGPGYPGAMPFKHNAARRHHIPRARYRVTNWPGGTRHDGRHQAGSRSTRTRRSSWC